MRFWALFKKEWRESVPVIGIAMAVLLVLGGGFIYMAAPSANAFWESRYWHPGEEAYCYYQYPFQEVSAILWFSSLGLGLCLGGLHFWEPKLTKTWAFLIHRSTSRAQILGAKLLCALMAIPIGLGASWLIVYGYSHWMQQEMIRPPYLRILLDGWIYICFGYLAYLATALAALVKTRWYTTRFFSFVWSLLIFICVVQVQPISALLWLSVGLVVLMVLIRDRFHQREFN